jgi:anti-sigma regulatory factor (Ser/Thr protein kinase)
VNAPAERGYRHTALLYDSTDELLTAAVPFLVEGLAAGEVAVLSCGREHSALLAEALGADARVVVMDREAIYTRPTAAVAAYRRMMLRQVADGASRVRLVGEVRVGDGPEDLATWARFEAVCNVALAPLPLSSVCAYDTRTLPDPLRESVVQTHPGFLTTGGRTPNHRYVDPVTVLRRSSSLRPAPGEAVDPALRLSGLTDRACLPDVRARLRAALAGPWWQEEIRRDFVAALAEVASNAFRHGRPPVDLRLWTTPSRLLCTVTDRGAGFDDPLAGYLPPGDRRAAGAGLWLARQSCDRLEAYPDRGGFTVRLTTRLPASASEVSATAWQSRGETAAVRAERAHGRAAELLRRFNARAAATEDLDRSEREARSHLPRLRDQLQQRRGRSDERTWPPG